MSLRVRLLLAFALVVFLPLGLMALGFRYEVTRKLNEQYQRQLDLVQRTVETDLRRTADTTQQQLNTLAAALPDDNDFRAALAGIPDKRQYLLDWAAATMRLTDMSLLQIFDENGQILSSGHFRNEHGRTVPGLVPALRKGGAPLALMRAPGTEQDLLALVRQAPVRVGDRTLSLVGGVIVNDTFLARLAGGPQVVITLRDADTTLTSAADGGALSANMAASSRPAVVEIRIPTTIVGSDGSVTEREAHFEIIQPRTELVTLLHSVDSWFFAAAAGAVVLALLAIWLASRITRRLSVLADKTAVIDLDRLDVEFDEGTDEVGRLSRVLSDLTERLRAGTARVREAERRATVGDLARQITHDIKNGLIPLRNVMRHLAQVNKEDPASLASVFEERRSTIDSSIGYLQTLATNYERLSITPSRRECDMHAMIDEVARTLGGGATDVRVDLAASDPRVLGDPVAIRRILENLITNAIDSLNGQPGRVTISTSMPNTDDGPILRVTVADTGRGLSPEETSRMFEHFYSTKPGGSGLGLSIVRRLVTDLRGSVHVESTPGQGTRMIVDIGATVGAAVQTGTQASSKWQTGGRRW